MACGSSRSWLGHRWNAGRMPGEQWNVDKRILSVAPATRRVSAASACIAMAGNGSCCGMFAPEKNKHVARKRDSFWRSESETNGPQAGSGRGRHVFVSESVGGASHSVVWSRWWLALSTVIAAWNIPCVTVCTTEQNTSYEVVRGTQSWSYIASQLRRALSVLVHADGHLA